MPLLVGCTSEPKPKAKIYLDYVETGGCFETNAEQMYQDIVKSKKSTIYILGDSSCRCATDAMRELKRIGLERHFESFYIEIHGMSTGSSDYAQIQQATRGSSDDDMYKIGDTNPSIYFFLQGEVAFRIGDSNLESYVSRYVEVSVPNS